MKHRIAIASGKGGTGKTTVALNIYNYLRELAPDTSILVDCDVEEPNDAIFLGNLERQSCKIVNQLIPEIDKAACTFCRKCVEYCEFNAIVVIPPVKFAEVNKELCHSCGACLEACEFNAISEIKQEVGKLGFFTNQKEQNLLEGRLRIGSAMQTLMIRELKKEIPASMNLVILDSPPGTSCPVVETISGCDYVILVAEPTPFGLHDLKLMVELLEKTKQSYGVIVNKAGIGNSDIYKYLKDNRIELLGKIPFIRDYARSYSEGTILTNPPLRIKSAYLEILKNLENKLNNNEGNNHSQW